MPLVIADASPINYLILIRQIEILPRLFERVVIPRIDIAAERGWIVFSSVVADLDRTSFRKPRAVVDQLLAKHRGRQ